MKKGLILGVALAVACVGAAGAMKHPEKGMCPMMKKPDKGCCCPLHAEAAKTMMKRELVATADGGVVVLQGNKLSKYDKDLNLVKELDLKCDVEAVRAKMREMCAACPMNKKAMKEAEKAAHCESKKQEKKEHEGHESEEHAEKPSAQPAQ
jgi:hypothetical protein